MTVLRGGRGVGPAVEGEVLVSRDAFSARYDLDRDRGVFSRPTHDLFGQSIVDKILVFTTAKGGVATAWALLDMKTRGVAPRGLVFQRTNPIMVQGAALADLPLLDSLHPDPVTTLRTGDRVRLDPRRGTVTLLNRPSTARSSARRGPRRRRADLDAGPELPPLTGRPPARARASRRSRRRGTPAPRG